MTLYVDRQGHLINRATWLALTARPEYVVIASDAVAVEGRRVQVMTMWLGLHLPSGRPRVFETLLHAVGGNRPCRWMWPSLLQAQAGHRHVVDELTTGQHLGVYGE
ncbi:hypothetical protein EV649_1961 [Kribbella sp. VKM Ac-2569]|uniref:hypothetical protein n=1 Tax=Kribbella sp. VKM Ac-2569 TaxID=2512220 RepID=UPI00102C2A9D|nr:hypothetical protein [Kribbella sp. VKM Ac-2569]RZT28185.1 hypothetical protein EV649_1961 [Kribbella sp. VKM Ac-2569]